MWLFVPELEFQIYQFGENRKGTARLGDMVGEMAVFRLKCRLFSIFFPAGRALSIIISATPFHRLLSHARLLTGNGNFSTYEEFSIT